LVFAKGLSDASKTSSQVWRAERKQDVVEQQQDFVEQQAVYYPGKAVYYPGKTIHHSGYQRSRHG
jgi:hypothetical protein